MKFTRFIKHKGKYELHLRRLKLKGETNKHPLNLFGLRQIVNILFDSFGNASYFYSYGALKVPFVVKFFNRNVVNGIDPIVAFDS